ncbi:MAG: oxygen-independent coproporphyrinogen III oxidase [Salinisphaeraceae bacterium]|nr:oxygen-independent coproporphyrinogen III oxidase [Salinisphaeraceae bacterium]
MQMNKELMADLDRSGPRYTSYPSANLFGHYFGPQDLLNALEQSNTAPARSLALYLHLPFCQQLCYYCGCTKIVTQNADKIKAYLPTVYREADLFAAAIDPEREVRQIHLGGGTPNTYSPLLLEEILDELRARFKVAADAEIGLEVDPRCMKLSDLEEYRLAGFNRISIGVQDFDPAVQKAINREQSQALIAALIDEARFVGFNGINVDLVYGLPKQTLSTFAHTLNDVIAMRPDRLAVYSYAHLPKQFKSQRLIQLNDLPTGEQKLELLELAVSKLTAAGYRHIGMDHFALPEDELARALNSGQLQRNFQGYSTRGGSDLLGLGMSAISSVGHVYAQNAKTLAVYTRHIERGHFATVKGLTLTPEEDIRRDLIQRLMCSGKVDMDSFGAEHGIDFDRYFERDLGRLKPYLQRGLITVSDHSLQVTETGRYLLRPMAMAFDPYMNQGETSGEFSKVI